MHSPVPADAETLQSLVDQVARAADRAAVADTASVEAILRQLDTLSQSQVDTKLLLDTQAGKRIRKLSKHEVPEVASAAAKLIEVWKDVVKAEQLAKGKQQILETQLSQGSAASQDRASSEPSSKRQKVGDGISASGSAASTSFDAAPAAKQPLKIPPSGDPARDKLRRQLAEALQLAAEDVPDANPGTIAAEVEAAVLRQNGAVNPKYKAKIRSVWVNLKDPSNPDFRRSVLSGKVTGDQAVEMKPEEMASNSRKEENQKIREHKLWEAERGQKRLATTDQFQCSRCKQRKCTYYQMQTRSADEPMTTFVQCTNCDHRWKFC